MPQPTAEESRSDFISRCVPIVMDEGTAETADQAVAICNSMYDEAKSMNGPDKHAAFIKAITERTVSPDSFGYGITTAEPYVKALLEMEKAGCSVGRSVSDEVLLKEAANRLCAAFPDMVVEKFTSTTETTDIGLGDTESPANTLMLIRHILTSDKQDRDGDILRTAGAQLDPKAPLLWQHQSFLPIGRVVKTVEQTSTRLVVVSALLDLNEIFAYWTTKNLKRRMMKSQEGLTSHPMKFLRHHSCPCRAIRMLRSSCLAAGSWKAIS
jgi:hypothetical protein